MEKSEIHCETERCKSAIEKYGENYHGVYDLWNTPPASMPDTIAQCQYCGAYTNGTIWKSVCQLCGKEVEPGTLKGFFVPHRCKECDAKIVAEEKATGQICRLCHTVRSYCCC